MAFGFRVEEFEIWRYQVASGPPTRVSGFLGVCWCSWGFPGISTGVNGFCTHWRRYFVDLGLIISSTLIQLEVVDLGLIISLNQSVVSYRPRA